MPKHSAKAASDRLKRVPVACESSTDPIHLVVRVWLCGYQADLTPKSAGGASFFQQHQQKEAAKYKPGYRPT